MDRDNITRIGARDSRVEELISSNGGALPSRLFGHSAGHKALATECTKGRCKPRVVWSMFGANLIYATWGQALPDSLQMPAFQPYWGKPAVRDDRGDGGNGGIIRSPISRHRPTRQTKAWWRLMKHRQTKGSATDRFHLNHRATPRLHRTGC